MIERNFFDQVSGQNSTLPWSAADALAAGYTRWMDRDGCEECQHAGRPVGPKARYLKDNSCSMCMMTTGSKLWEAWINGHGDRPTPWSTHPDTSRTLGIDWYYGSQSHPVVCVNGPHLRKTSIKTLRCVDCDADRKYFSSLLKGPRAAARAAGEKYYLPADPCPSCGTIARRHVVTNGCTGCHDLGTSVGATADARRTPSQVFAEENPEFILSREAAKGIGLTLFRTGEPCRRGHAAWRYVSTGNCLACLRG